MLQLIFQSSSGMKGPQWEWEEWGRALGLGTDREDGEKSIRRGRRCLNEVIMIRGGPKLLRLLRPLERSSDSE